MSPAPNIRHQEVAGEIYFAISLLLRKNPLGKVLIAPTDVRLSNQNILQPGILFVKNENLYKIKEKGIEGAPELIVEVLSPPHLNRIMKKKIIYERFGVNEYFLVDPGSKSVDSYFLKEGVYGEQETLTGKINSKISGTKISF